MVVWILKAQSRMFCVGTGSIYSICLPLYVYMICIEIIFIFSINLRHNPYELLYSKVNSWTLDRDSLLAALCASHICMSNVVRLIFHYSIILILST